jgi:opacity protein-like surface antigen
MGMSLHYLNALPIEGNITGGMSADYKYMITSSALMADMALSYNPLTPHVEGLYVRLSLGASRNTAHSYKRINGDSSGSPSLGFANHTQTAFAYGVGIGAQFKVAPHLLVGPEYRYLNLGDVSLGNGHALNSGTKKVTVTDPLKWGQLKLHGMMVINVSYLF